MRLGRFVVGVVLLWLQPEVECRALGGKPSDFIIAEHAPLQDIVTWDEHSLFVHGERIIFWGGEVHPFRFVSLLDKSGFMLIACRLPVPSLWLDVFQKIKALGYNGVSIYTPWVLHEPKQGSFQADGVFGYESFFEAAKEVGVYLVAVSIRIILGWLIANYQATGPIHQC